MAIHDLAPGACPGNPVDITALLAFGRCALSVKPRRDLGAIEVWISDGGSRPVVVVLAPKQAMAVAALLIMTAAAVEPVPEVVEPRVEVSPKKKSRPGE
jgi:hypothetical protein